jgi:FtsP/CotA-like multicopper oxidase with cupredoxin domain
MQASSHSHHRTATGVALRATVLALVIGLVLSGVASARQAYEAPLARHGKVAHGKKKHKRAKHRRARAAAVSIDLCAKAGTVTLPDATTLPTWGFVKKPPAGSCTDPGVDAQIPAPVLDVNAGDPVTVNVQNLLPDALALDIPGIRLDAGPTDVPAGGSRTVTFTANNPGTYLYESSGDAGRQAEVGLAGALIVRPAVAGRAYNDASTAFNKESVMVLSEIVPGLNNAAAQTCGSQSCLGSFEMYDYKTDPTDGPDVARVSNFKPAYRLINGKAYPQIPSINAAAGDRVLLRYVNAGGEQATTTMLGTSARMVGRGASPLGTPFDFVAETFPAGSAADAIVTVPASASSGTKFPIYDRHLELFNGAAAGLGGRIRFIEVP